MCGFLCELGEMANISAIHENNFFFFFFFLNIIKAQHCLMFKGIVHPKMYILSLITFQLRFCRSKPSFIFRTQIKICLMHCESSHRQQGSLHDQGSESSKEIVKIIHVTSVVRP